MPNTSRLIHREEYLYLAGLTESSALIAWGAFFFKVETSPGREKWKLIDEDDLKRLPQPRKTLIGEKSESYAGKNTPAVVTLTDKGTREVRTLHVPVDNHASLTELKPDTTYAYSVKINGKDWGTGPLRDWQGDDKGRLELSGSSYLNEFRTFPDPAQPSPPVAFAVLGDPGRGVHRDCKDGHCQGAVAAALRVAVEGGRVRFILTTGDNIYRGGGQGTGKEDDDWFFSYFQPYRYVINRVPVFPSVGNHDDGEAFFESSDDRDQLYDNLYIRHRFAESSIDPGLFYRVRYGADIELISLDTSKRGLLAERYFRHPKHRQFVDSAFPEGSAAVWRVPFFHHPPFCAGPNHSNSESVIKHLVPRFRRSGVRAVFCGHEHNFQQALDNGIQYFVTGGSGKFDARPLDASRFISARTQAWGGNDEGHFLLVEINGNRMTVTPVGTSLGGAPKPIDIKVVGGGSSVPPFIVQR